MAIDKIKTIEIESAIADYFNYRHNIIVPNVSWGMSLHECDILIVSSHRYATEVEIKISIQDLKNDFKKHHHHLSSRIKSLYFAIPSYLLDKSLSLNLIPNYAGIITCTRQDHKLYDYDKNTLHIVNKVTAHSYRKPHFQPSVKFSESEINQLLRLGTLRIWTLKKQLIKSQGLIKITSQSKYF